jgi:hypothetical protein
MAIARARFHEDLTTAIVPGVLEDFDLPDLAASLAPRPLWIVDPRSPTGALLAPGVARAEYRVATGAYARAGAEDALRILHRPEGWPLGDVYAEWLGATPAPSGSP